MNPSATDNKWDNKWNQTGDLIIPTDGNDLFTISKWDGQTEGWGKYEYVKPTVSFMGSLTDWNNGSVMTEGDIYTLDINVETAEEQKFKIKVGDSWFGNSKLTVEGITLKTTDNDCNCIFDAEVETYHLEYTLSGKTLTFSHTTLVNPTEEVTSLLTKYFNDRTYTRNTVINLNEGAKNELAKYWHAGSDLL